MSRPTAPPVGSYVLAAALVATGVTIPTVTRAYAAPTQDIACTGTSSPQATCLYQVTSTPGVFTFPPGVQSVQISLRGGDGGNGGSDTSFAGGAGGLGGSLGGEGGPVTITRAQAAGNKLMVYVGSIGGAASCDGAGAEGAGGVSGGLRTGGDGGPSEDFGYCSGGGGGGATIVAKAGGTASGAFLPGAVLAVAGGGGGGGGADPNGDGFDGFPGGDGGDDGSGSARDGSGPNGGRSGNNGGGGGIGAKDGAPALGGDGAQGGDFDPSGSGSGCTSPCGAGGGGGGGYVGGGGGGQNSGGGGGCQFAHGTDVDCSGDVSGQKKKQKKKPIAPYRAAGLVPGFAEITYQGTPDQSTGPVANDPSNRNAQGRFDRGHTRRSANEVVCRPEVGVCTIRVTGPDSKFVVTARGGKRRAVLFGKLEGGTMPDCRNYTERQSDWLQFGFRDGEAGSTWRKTSSITTRKVLSKAKALKRAKAMQVCFEAPYYFAPRPGFGVVKTGKVWTGVLPDCPSASGGPCVTGREIRSFGDAGWVVRLIFRIPATPLDPKALG
ncbi:MAG: hypothetical protein ACT4QF_13455 [Sporichthyaceae bacterium]